MPRVLRIRRVELDRAQTRICAQMGSCQLIRPDVVVKTLPRLRITIRPREPARAPPVRLIGNA